MNNAIRFCFLLLLTLGCASGPAGAEAAAKEGVLQTVAVSAPSLAGNKLAVSATQQVAVYLPPSYDASQRRYPVVYFLTGFGSQVRYFVQDRTFQGFDLKEAMDRLIAEGKIEEMIVVIAGGLTPLGGSFYVNSPANGNWEDYVVRDLVAYVDGRFRTIASLESRALAGHSMGGFGSFNIAMRHPDVFGAVYSLSPGMAAPGELKTHPAFASAVRPRVFATLQKLSGVDENGARAALLAEAAGWDPRADSALRFAFAYSLAFAPAPAGDPRLIEYPYDTTDPAATPDARIWERDEQGFGEWKEKIVRNAANLKKLSSITIDVGENDHYAWIPAGCRYVSQLLKAEGIGHTLALYPGDHGDKLRDRIENHMLPTLSRALKAER